jgi:glutamyl-tRNA synthetase
VPLIKERIKKLSDFVPLTDFLWEKPEYDKAQFKKLKIKDQKLVLERILEKLKQFKRPWKKEDFESQLQELASKLEISNRDFFQLIRVGISGQLVTPPLFESMQILGEEESLKRFGHVIENFESLPDLGEMIISE